MELEVRGLTSKLYLHNIFCNVEKNYIYNICPFQRMEGMVASRDNGTTKAPSVHPSMLQFVFTMKMDFQFSITSEGSFLNVLLRDPESKC